MDFLAAKTRRLRALDRLLALAPTLEAAGAPPITEDEIQAEVEVVRTARRARRENRSTVAKSRNYVVSRAGWPITVLGGDRPGH